ncbi:hypothetical protein BDW71DRAFT_183933 [Aspergillus fruticulosus]
MLNEYTRTCRSSQTIIKPTLSGGSAENMALPPLPRQPCSCYPAFDLSDLGLLVGIGGGIPSKEADIRLGDVVVGVPTSGETHGGVVQYDLRKATPAASLSVQAR